MPTRIADIEIPDTTLVAEATELVREAASPLIFHHSRRVYLFGALRGREQGGCATTPSCSTSARCSTTSG